MKMNLQVYWYLYKGFYNYKSHFQVTAYPE
jgi:hypothetical protein